MIRLEKYRFPALIGGLMLLALAAVPMLHKEATAFQSWLVAFSFWNGISLGALLLLMINHMSGGRWGIVIRRQLEAAVSVLPIGFLLFLPLCFGMKELYLWARPEVMATDVHLQKIAIYLNPTGYVVRSICFFAIWIFMGWRLLSRSDRQDKDKNVPSFERVAAPGLVVLFLTVTFALTDWMMSLEPHWFSTIYGVEVLAGNSITALCLSIIMASYLKGEPQLREAAVPARFHDLGNLLFANTMFWTYTNFSQFILIWSANLADEAPWYILRREHGWNCVAIGIIFLHFVFPFYILIIRAVKKSPKWLAAAATLLLFAEWLYKFWMIVPPGRPQLALLWTDLVAFLGMGGVWFFFFLTRLRSRPLVPLGDIELAEAGS